MDRFKIIVSVILIIISLQSIGLWIGQKNLNQKISVLEKQPAAKIVTDLNLPSPAPSPSLTPSPSLILSPQPSTSPPTTLNTTPTIPFQTQIIYLGSANTTKTEWSESNIEVRLNSSDYPDAIIATFEAGLSTINGEAWARLKNKTSGAIMSITEIFNNTNSVVWKTSPGFRLHSGDNIYVVELKSSSSEIANLSGARIKISK